MKKLVLFFAIAIAAVSANAQTGKGTWLVGGSAGFSTSKQSGSSSTTTVNISPDAGYFFADNLAVGANIGFMSVKDAYTQFNIGPFVRYYFLPLGENAKLFGQGNIGFGSYKPSGGSSTSSFNWGLAAGPAFFLNEHVALETTLSYGSFKYSGFDATNTFAVNVGFQIHIGNGGNMSKKK